MVNGIDLKSLTVGYSNPVIEDVNLKVKPGEIVALIGPNGAGKSTVLKTITRQLKKLEGNILLLGQDEEKLSEAEFATKLSMVMTERINPELMTCFDVVSTGRYPYTGSLGILSDVDKEKVNEAIELVNGKDVAPKLFSKVSDGQRQRVMLARAICQEPQVLILDEPTSFLDVQYKIDLLSVLKRLAKEKNIAILMSMHELEFVPAMADFVVAVEGSKVAMVGTPQQVITGENIEKLYHMKAGTGQVLVDGLWKYALGLKEILCQR